MGCLRCTGSEPIRAGKVELKVLENSAVSSTQTVAYIPEQRALIVGDLVHSKTHAWLEGGIVNGKPQPALVEWQKALDELLAYPKTTVYGGRGDSAPVAHLEPQRASRGANQLAAVERVPLRGEGRKIFGDGQHRLGRTSHVDLR